jgi:hypothetical protein
MEHVKQRLLFGEAIVKKLFRISTILSVHLSICAVSCAQQAPLSDSTPRELRDGATLVSLFRPVYPPLARQANIWGDVRIAMTVRPDGTTEAFLESGHPMLTKAALESAWQSHFECRMCRSPAFYVLVYAFRKVEGPDCCSAFAAPVRVKQEPPSNDEQGRAQTVVIIAAEQVCFCDPSSELTKKRTRSLKCLYLWKCSYDRPLL